MNKKMPCTEYGRLLYALHLEHDTALAGNQLSRVSQMLELKICYASDCVRRGHVVTSTVLRAAQDKGVNPDFIKDGTLPVHLEGASRLGN